jgi:hypothetical protein
VNCRDLGVQQQADALLAMHRREHRSEHGTDRPQRLVQGFHHGHLAAEAACDRSHLQPDEAGTDDR